MRACKEEKEPSYKREGTHGGRVLFFRVKKNTRGKVSELHTSSIPFPPSLAIEKLLNLVPLPQPRIVNQP